ncbi:MAG: radical SAM protein [Candidatus Binatia bacterium]
MAPTPAPRSVDGVARTLLAPLLDGRLAASGWRVINWDAEQGICVTLERGTTCLLIELEGRNDQLDCYARTARFNVCVRRQFDDRPLDDADRELVDAVVAMVGRREGRLPAGARAAATRPTQVREVLVDRVLMSEGRDQYYINPYVGCMIACPYCYVIDRADFSRGLEGQPQLPWGRYLDVKVNAAEVLRREIAGGRRGVVRMSPIVTDPYQPAERRYRITRQCLEVLLDSELAPVVLTRAPRILEDVPLLARFRRALVGFSIPTDQDRYRQIFEPDADPIDARLDALRQVHAAGIGAFAVIQPILPMDPERLVDAVAPYVRAVRIDRLYVGERVRHLYEQHDLSAFAGDDYVDDALARLAQGFQARGVVVNALDDLAALL